MPRIVISESGKEYEYEIGESLLEILLYLDIFVDNPCNGKGTCGKCRVQILGENCPEPTAAEEKFVSSEDLKLGIRLSCEHKPTRDLEIKLLQKELRHDVLTGGFVPEFEFNPDIRKASVEIHKPSLDDQTPLEEQIKAQLPGIEISHTAMLTADFILGAATAVIVDEKVIAIESGDTREECYGVAIDIGTTTVVCSVIDINTGKEVGSAAMVNAQKTFGLDVLTRITYENEHIEDGIGKLQKAIVNSINDMIGKVVKENKLNRSRIYELAIAANCTMMHMLLGIDAKPIGRSPFAPIFTASRNIGAAEIGIAAAPGARVYCLPSVSSYIGADIVAGVYVCDLESSTENVLFIDIGTNGEIVLSKRGRLLSCSCAAGPALEGMNISAGMRAEPGAIEELHLTESGLELQTIADAEPIGICGSGILAAIRELINSGLLRKTGAFIKADKLAEDDYRTPYLYVDEAGKRSFILNDKAGGKMMITQGDVRQVQLAKGAILSGFLALLKKAGIEMKDLDKVMIAGQFGAHLPAESLTGTGILPDEVGDRLVYVGNSSKTGAYMALMSTAARREMESLAHHMDYMELGAVPGYERLFSDCLIFPKR